MRAALDETGRLKISAESAVESFALSHWFSMWQAHTATLQVETIERRDGQAVENYDVPAASMRTAYATTGAAMGWSDADKQIGALENVLSKILLNVFSKILIAAKCGQNGSATYAMDRLRLIQELADIGLKKSARS